MARPNRYPVENDSLILVGFRCGSCLGSVQRILVRARIYPAAIVGRSSTLAHRQSLPVLIQQRHTEGELPLVTCRSVSVAGQAVSPQSGRAHRVDMPVDGGRKGHRAQPDRYGGTRWGRRLAGAGQLAPNRQVQNGQDRRAHRSGTATSLP